MPSVPKPTRTPKSQKESQLCKRSRAQVALRANGRCEITIANGFDFNCVGSKLWCEWAHVFGRGKSGLLLPEEYASSPELTIYLCKEHHVAYDEYRMDLNLRYKIQHRAVRLFAEQHGLGWQTSLYPTWDPKDVIRDMVRDLAKR